MSVIGTVSRMRVWKLPPRDDPGEGKNQQNRQPATDNNNNNQQQQRCLREKIPPPPLPPLATFNEMSTTKSKECNLSGTTERNTEEEKVMTAASAARSNRGCFGTVGHASE